MDEAALRDELAKQVERLRTRGLEITHLDGHQHALAFPKARAAGVELARKLGAFLRIPEEPPVPFALEPSLASQVATICENGRALRPLARGVATVDAFRGIASRVGTCEPIDRLRASLGSIAPGSTAELMVHPACDDPRAAELAALVDPSWPDWLADRGIALVSFRDLLEEIRVRSSAGARP